MAKSAPGDGSSAKTTARRGKTKTAGSFDGGTEAAEPGSLHLLLEDGRSLIILSGEIDASLRDDLHETADSATKQGKPIVVDARHVTFMDSTGVAFLARLANGSHERVKVTNVPPTVQFLLDATRIGELLDVERLDAQAEVAAQESTASRPAGQQDERHD